VNYFWREGNIEYDWKGFKAHYCSGRYKKDIHAYEAEQEEIKRAVDGNEDALFRINLHKRLGVKPLDKPVKANYNVGSNLFLCFDTLVRKCKHCGTSFYGRRAINKFCSDHCEVEYRKKISHKSVRAYRLRNKKVPVKVECKHCKKIFKQKRKDAKFCSGKCRTANHRTTIR